MPYPQQTQLNTTAQMQLANLAAISEKRQAQQGGSNNSGSGWNILSTMASIGIPLLAAGGLWYKGNQFMKHYRGVAENYRKQADKELEQARRLRRDAQQWVDDPVKAGFDRYAPNWVKQGYKRVREGVNNVRELGGQVKDLVTDPSVDNLKTVAGTVKGHVQQGLENIKDNVSNTWDKLTSWW